MEPLGRYGGGHPPLWYPCRRRRQQRRWHPVARLVVLGMALGLAGSAAWAAAGWPGLDPARGAASLPVPGARVPQPAPGGGALAAAAATGTAAAPAAKGIPVADGIATAGHWRLEIRPRDDRPLDSAWASGRDAAGLWRSLTGRREGDAWIFDIPADPPLEEVRFGAGSRAEPGGAQTPGRAPGEGNAPGPSPVTWRVTWQPAGSGRGVTVGRVTAPPEPVWRPEVPGVGEPPAAVERPRWGPPPGTGRGSRRSGAPRGPAAPQGEGAIGLPASVPAFEVTLPTFRTTHWQPVERGHVLWRWSFGDGTGLTDPDPRHAITHQPHRFPREGRYAVEATSYDATGRALIRYRWQVTIAPADAVARAVAGLVPGVADDAAVAAGRELALWRTFAAAAPQAPRVELRLEGPRAWVVGRPATFRLEAEVQNPPFTERVEVDYDPGPVFSVRWRRPGTFQVDGAVRVRVHYRIHGRAIALSHVYRVSQQVQVHALHLED